MRICNHCGAALDRPMLRCPSCGADVRYTLNGQPFEEPAAPSPERPAGPEDSSAASAEPPREPAGPEEPGASAAEPPREPAGPRYARQAAAPPAENDAGLTTLQYFLLLILSAIPVIGLIAMLVLALTAQRTACRRFATAMLIFRLGGIALLFAVLVSAAFFIFRSGVWSVFFQPHYLPWEDYYYYNDWGSFYSEDTEPETHPTAAKDIYSEAFFAATGWEIV